MSLFYKPNRKPDWNYGGPKWRLSRSKIALFMECPRCFYIDNVLGVARPPGFPFNLNSAVDALLKKEFDALRPAHFEPERNGLDSRRPNGPGALRARCVGRFHPRLGHASRRPRGRRAGAWPGQQLPGAGARRHGDVGRAGW